jgi:prevent-host-death family protein
MNAPPRIVTAMTSKEFNQDTAKAKRAAENGPVFVTTRGRSSHVLLSIDEYQRLKSGRRSLLDALADDRPEADFEFEVPEFKTIFKGLEFD